MTNFYEKASDVINELELKVGSVIIGTTIDMPLNSQEGAYMANINAIASMQEAKELLAVFKKAELYDSITSQVPDDFEKFKAEQEHIHLLETEIKELQN